MTNNNNILALSGPVIYYYWSLSSGSEWINIINLEDPMVLYINLVSNLQKDNLNFC